LQSRVTTMFDPTGLQLNDPVVHSAAGQTVILDYSGGRFPLTARWLTAFFGANIVTATPASAPPANGQQTYGLVIVLGHDFARRWYGGVGRRDNDGRVPARLPRRAPPPPP